jgi:hypothetical protein
MHYIVYCFVLTSPKWINVWDSLHHLNGQPNSQKSRANVREEIIAGTNKSVVIWLKMFQLHLGSRRTFCRPLLNSVQTRLSKRFGNWTVEVQSAPEVGVLDEVSQVCRVRSDVRRNTQDLYLGLSMDKLKLTGQNMGCIFNYRCGHASAKISTRTSSKQHNLKLKTWPKQVLGSPLLAFVLPGLS